MPEENPQATNELQAAIAELDKEREERHERDQENRWNRYIAVSTAFLAVFAAIAALQSGSLEDEAMISQIKAADTRNIYESDQQKEHLYTVQAYGLVDRGAKPQPGSPRGNPGDWAPLPPSQRANQYITNVQQGTAEESALSSRAKDLEATSERQLDRQNRFAKAVALLSVAIALSALASLLKSKPVWYGSLATGAIGIVFFAAGFV